MLSDHKAICHLVTLKNLISMLQKIVVIYQMVHTFKPTDTLFNDFHLGSTLLLFVNNLIELFLLLSLFVLDFKLHFSVKLEIYMLQLLFFYSSKVYFIFNVLSDGSF